MQRALLLSILCILYVQARADLVVDPIAVDFGDVALVRLNPASDSYVLRFFVEVAIEIHNSGSDPVQILGASISPPSPFDVHGSRCDVVDPLLPGKTCAIVVRYAPRDEGGHSAVLEVRQSVRGMKGSRVGGEDLVVPLWGDAVAVDCAGSECDGPALSFGIGTPGNGRNRLIGFVNEGPGDILAGGALADPDGFGAGFPPPRMLSPGGRFEVVISQGFEAPPGPRRAISIWSFPPPMLPVIKQIRIPLVCEVIDAFLPVLRSELPSPLRFRPKGPVALVARAKRAEAARRLMVPGARDGGGGGGAVAISLAKRKAGPALSMDPWVLIPLGTEDPILGIAGMISARPKEPATAAVRLRDRLGTYALAMSRRKAMLVDLEARRKIDEIDLASPFSGIIAPSHLRQARVYAVRRARDAMEIAAIRPNWFEGSAIRRSPALLARKEAMPIILGRRATRIRALDAVPVRLRDGTWAEMLVAGARYREKGAPAETAVRKILLLGKRGRVVDARADLAPEGGEILAIGALREKGPSIRALVSRPRGKIHIYRASARRAAGGGYEWDWAYRGRRMIGYDAIALRRTRAATEWKEDIVYALGRREASLLAVSGRLVRGAKEDAFPAGIRRRSAARARHAFEGGLRPMVILRRERAGYAAFAYRSALPGDGGPVPYTGDSIYLATAARGEKGAWVTIEAHAFHPDGGALIYGWTAPGIVFENPTSATPRAYFPIGETEVFLVVRDLPADDPRARESAPRMLRVIVSGPPLALGDANGDGQLDIGDAVTILNYLFSSGPLPVPPEIVEVNGDCALDIGDAVWLLSYLFVNGPAPIACPGK